MDGKPRLLDRLREQIRVRHYSIRTETAYVTWVWNFIRYHGLRHPAEMGAAEVERFLSHLAVDRNVSASTQNQALAALLFLYKHVLAIDLPWLDDVIRAKRPERLPVVLSREETQRLLACFEGEMALVTGLLYGSGMRLMEAMRLRVKDVNFARNEILIRDGKGMKDRVTLLPGRLVAPLTRHLDYVKALHERDLAEGFGEVYLPFALARKYLNAAKEWGWQYVFLPTGARSILAPASGAVTTWMRSACSAPSRRRCGNWESPSRPRRIRYATVSPRTCWKAARTSAPCRSCWAMRT